MEMGRTVLILGSTALIGWSVQQLRKAYKINQYLKGARVIDQMYYEKTLKELDVLKRMHGIKEDINVEINAPILH